MTRRLVVALALAVLFAVPHTAGACSCAASGPACQAFWQSDAVFDGLVTRIDIIPLRLSSVPDQVYRQKLVTFQVLTPWRGVSGGQVSVRTGMGGGDCGFGFEPNHRYLVYAFRNEGDGQLGAGICGRTREIDKASEDAAYLASLSRPASGARVFGEVSHWRPVFNGNDPGGGKEPVETQIYLTGSDGTRVTSSSPKDGTFAFSNLAAGHYTVRVVEPHALESYEPSRSVEIPDVRACAQTDFFMRDSGRIQGTLTGPDGQPVRPPAVQATRYEDWSKPSSDPRPAEGYVDGAGHFEITGLPPGRYVIAINLLGRAPSEYLPYDRIIYSRDGADPTPIDVEPGQAVQLPPWRLPPAYRVVTVTGKVVWDEGVAEGRLSVMAKDGSRFAAGASVDESGRFSIKLLETRRYHLDLNEFLQGQSGPAVRGQLDIQVRDGAEPITIVARKRPQ